MAGRGGDAERKGHQSGHLTAPSTVGSVPIQVEVSSEEGMKATGFATMLVSVSPTGPIITSVNPRKRRPGTKSGSPARGSGQARGKPDRRRRDGKRHSQLE